MNKQRNKTNEGLDQYIWAWRRMYGKQKQKQSETKKKSTLEISSNLQPEIKTKSERNKVTEKQKN